VRGFGVTFRRSIPILRSFDEAKAREFYVDFLGFSVDFEHRFEPALPLYLGLSKGECLVHVSEHHGDCSPGAAIRIETDELEAFVAELLAKNYKYCRPGIEETPWGTRETSVQDPFGNRLTFYQKVTTSEPSPASGSAE
jgi:uncharacterized glyoxalase superfamily protein PhnB